MCDPIAEMLIETQRAEKEFLQAENAALRAERDISVAAVEIITRARKHVVEQRDALREVLRDYMKTYRRERIPDGIAANYKRALVNLKYAEHLDVQITGLEHSLSVARGELVVARMANIELQKRIDALELAAADRAEADRYA
jgi:peptide deformylase